MNESVKPLRVSIRVRNNAILRAIERETPSISQWCETHKIAKTIVYEYARLQRVPKRKNGEWKPCAMHLASLLRLPEQELWPEMVMAITTTHEEREVDVPSGLLLESPVETTSTAEIYARADVRIHFEKAFQRLTPREEHILRSMYGIGKNSPDGIEKSAQEIAVQFGTTSARVFSLRKRALEKMRSMMDSLEIGPGDLDE